MTRVYSIILWICWLSPLQFCQANRQAQHPSSWGTRGPPACLAATRRGRRRQPSSSKGGFGDDPVVVQTRVETTTPKKKAATPIYSKPALYDLAFGYRNYEEEVGFLIGQHQLLHGGKAPKRTLEVAAGPARHSVFALQSSYVQEATALDNSPEMVDYAKTVAQEELDADKLDSFSYVQANMENFELEEQCESAWILLGSLQHLTDNAQVINCFQSINRVLAPGGTLILELPHPRETFSMVECTRNGWEVPLEDENGDKSGELKIIWGDDNDDFDPITQVRQFTVALELEGVSEEDQADLQSVREIVPLRLFTTQEIAAMAQIAGFKVASLHGALADGVEVNDEDEAFRLVCVLQKV